MTVQEQLSNIANLAYGSGTFEKTKGGRGNIGLVGDHVVKFNTHYGEGKKESDLAEKACDSLRQTLYSFATQLLGESGIALKDYESELASIRKKLGLGEDGQMVEAKGLLERKTVASVIRQIDARTGANSFENVSHCRDLSSRGKSTSFDSVNKKQRLVMEYQSVDGHPAEQVASRPFSDRLKGAVAQLQLPGMDALLDELKDALAPLDRELAAMQKRLEAEKGEPGSAAQMNRLEIDLNNVLKALKKKKNSLVYTDDTVAAVASKINSMKDSIVAIRGEGVTKVAQDALKDFLPDYSSPKDSPVLKYLNDDGNLRELTNIISEKGEEEATFREVRDDLRIKLPDAFDKFSKAAQNYLSAKDAKSVASALKDLNACAKRLSRVKLGETTQKLLSFLSDPQAEGNETILNRFGANKKLIDLLLLGVDENGCRIPLADFAQKMRGNANEIEFSRLADRLKSFRTYLAPSYGIRPAGDRILNGLLTGQFGIDAYLNARVWQATPDMIDLTVRDAYLVSSEPLGSGRNSTTYLCRYEMPDGTERSYVFKPEQTARAGNEKMALAGAGTYRSDQELVHLNFAAAKVAREFGLRGKVPDIRVGSQKGVFGQFMDVAPGASLDHIQHNPGGVAAQKIGAFMKASPERNYGKVVHATTDLEWLDAIIGNGDRHGGNYHIDVDPASGSVSVTGIDNDTTFPPWHLGFGKFRLDESRFDDLSAALGSNDETLKGLQTAIATKLKAEYNVDEALAKSLAEQILSGKDGQVTFNVYAVPADDSNVPRWKEIRNWLGKVAYDTWGVQGVGRPKFISQEVYDKLATICGKKDADLFQYVTETYGPHLKDTDQIEAMVSRLKDAWKYAQELGKEGRLMKGDMWSGEDCFEMIKADWADEEAYSPGNLNENYSIGHFNGDFRRFTHEILGAKK